MRTSSLEKALQGSLARRQERSSLRKLTIAPRQSVDFSSNDFLSLSTSSELKSEYLRNLAQCEEFRLGSGGSRLLDGNSIYAEELERDLAAFHHAPSGLLFNSGFDANSGFFSCVPLPGDVVFHDEFIHASVHEGMRLSRAGCCISFKHNSVEDLQHQLLILLKKDALIEKGERNVFIAIESLYSMDGDLAPIRDIVEVVGRLLPHGNGHIVVDEAHSTGVYGPQGRGIVCSLGLEDKIFARLHTFGKALASQGAIILCSEVTRQFLINYARPMIYTTFISFPALVAIKTTTSFMMRGGTVALSNHLWALVEHLYDQLKILDTTMAAHAYSRGLLRIPRECPQSPIFSVLTNEPRALANACQNAGFVVRAIVPPTVPHGGERVRICLHAGNTKEESDMLLATIGLWLSQMATSHSGNAEDSGHRGVGTSKL
ncbi:hypothetical protein BP6252_08101 [Coleophoma cylindrospora]|uniref:Aminotransferase class I/classII large domain-containing protein n=1 Tax=Coleophoma cylindrospora TaxID=1849047 RepID=A0A3D8RC97_9HELO|nr:hypothetical protein BP6252_08101 [Coleophoma cylindrospora]